MIFWMKEYQNQDEPIETIAANLSPPNLLIIKLGKTHACTNFYFLIVNKIVQQPHLNKNQKQRKPYKKLMGNIK